MKISNFQFIKEANIARGHAPLSKILLAFFIVFLFNSVEAFADEDDIIFIPDSIFKEKLLNEWGAQEYVDKNRDGEIQRWEAERYTGRFYMVLGSVKSLVGIKAFKNVYRFELTITDADSLDISGMENLYSFHSWHGGFKSMNASGCTSLQIIECLDGNLKEINLSGCTNLEQLRCYTNQLDEIDLSGLDNLKSCNFSGNNIRMLESFPSSLLSFSGTRNQLSSLNVSSLSKLQSLWFEENDLIKLNLKTGNNKNMEYLDVTNNPNLKCVDVDDPQWSEENWREYFDADVVFSLDCKSCIEEEAEKSFRVYPNPSTDFVYIRRYSDKASKLQIIDISGRVCQELALPQGQHEVIINIGGLSTGSYVMDIDDAIEMLVVE